MVAYLEGYLPIESHGVAKLQDELKTSPLPKSLWAPNLAG